MSIPTSAWLTQAKRRDGVEAIYMVVISLDDGDLRMVDVKQKVGQLDALQVLDGPRAIGATIVPFSGKSTVSSISLSIIDKNQFFSKLASSKFMLNRKVEIKVGFANIDEADFFTEYTGTIKEVPKMVRPGRWTVNVRDAQADLDEKIPTESSTALVNTAFWNEPDVPGYVVASAQDSPPRVFTDVQTFDSTNVAERTLMTRLSVDTLRLYQVTSITVAAGFTTWDLSSATPLTDGVVNSLGSELLGDNLGSIMLNIMKRADLPDEKIQVASIISERDNFFPTIRARRILAKPTKALTLLREVAEVAMMSVFPDGDNRLSGKFFAPPAPHDDTFELDTSRIQPIGNVAVTPDMTLFANRIVIMGNHDGSQEENTENFGRIDIFADADSQSPVQNQRVKTREIKSLWLHSSVTDASWYSVVGLKILKRTGHPPRRLATATFLDGAQTNLASMMSVSHPDIAGQPNAKTSVGINQELWQLLSKKVDVVEGQVAVALMDARIDRLPGWISHSFQADYPAATGLDQRHAYIGTPEVDGRTSVNSGQDDGYYIQ